MKLLSTAGIALSIMTSGFSQQLLAGNDVHSETFYQKSVLYKVDNQGVLKATLESQLAEPVQFRSKFEDEMQRLHTENRHLQQQVSHLAEQIEILKYNASQAKPHAEYGFVARQFQENDMPRSVERHESTDDRFKDISKKIGVDNQTAPEDQVKPYVHHVVYIFKNKQDQRSMWSLLAKQGEDDRWQGMNTLGTRQFIYVGAFQSQEEAQERALHIEKITQVKPLVYSRWREIG